MENNQQTAVEWLEAEFLKLESTVGVHGVMYELIEKAKEMEGEQKKQLQPIPYQLCPKCNGQGQVSKPPYIPADVHVWASSSGIFFCDVCNGSKIIPMYHGK